MDDIDIDYMLSWNCFDLYIVTESRDSLARGHGKTMKRRDFLKNLGCGTAFFAATGNPSVLASAGEQRPNILMIVVDDLGYAELSCQGSTDIPTPHIDSIAGNGIRFTDGYVSGPVCCPSRAGYMTGRYQTRFGHEFNAIGVQNNEEGIGLPLSETTMADSLKKEGYATGLVGKWHLGGSPPYHPLRRGFDEFYGFLHEGHYYVPPPYEGVSSYLRITEMPPGTKAPSVKGRFIFDDHFHYDEPQYDRENPILDGTKAVVEEEYLTDALTRESIDFISRHRDEPFFLYLSYNSPHSPLQAPDEDMQRFEHIDDIHRRVFAAMVSNLDDNIGKVLEKLRELGIEENTLILFFSDNGGPTKELTSSNEPLRGGKGQLFEGGIRVPFLIQWKDHLPEGKVYRNPVISLDAMPTALAAAGAKESIPNDLDGVNLLPYLTGKKTNTPHEFLFWRYGDNIAIRKGDWKLVRQRVRWGEEGEFMLFNLAGDIGETTDLLDENPEVVRELKTELDRIDDRMAEPLWRGKWNPTKENRPLRFAE